MRKFVIAALALGGLPAAALGQPDYDRNLEKAAVAIVAAKIGELRRGFEVDQKPTFVTGAEADQALARPGEWRRGLALATDRRSVPTYGF